MKHIKTPVSAYSFLGQCYLKDAQSVSVAMTFSDAQFDNELRAKDIATAVNNHDRLLEALKELLPYMEQVAMETKGSTIAEKNARQLIEQIEDGK